MTPDVAVLGVVHPGVEPYLEAYLASLERQTEPAFDLLLANDGVRDLESRCRRRRLRSVVWAADGTPAAIRRQLVDHASAAGYRYLVFSDSDDRLAPNRVEKSLELLATHDVVVNDLTTITADGAVEQQGYLSQRLDNRQTVDVESQLDKNVMGVDEVTRCPKRCIGSASGRARSDGGVET